MEIVNRKIPQPKSQSNISSKRKGQVKKCWSARSLALSEAIS